MGGANEGPEMRREAAWPNCSRPNSAAIRSKDVFALLLPGSEPRTTGLSLARLPYRTPLLGVVGLEALRAAQPPLRQCPVCGCHAGASGRRCGAKGQHIGMVLFWGAAVFGGAGLAEGGSGWRAH